jgi:aminoglycoside phosphotransferase (APT) family kinase protein
VGRRRYARSTRLTELEKVGEGREAEIFALGDGSVLRLMRDPGSAVIAEREAGAIAAARRVGAAAPRVHELVTVEGRPGMVQDRVEGRDMLTDLNRRPWSLGAAARSLGRLHARIHEATASDPVPELKQAIRERLEGSDLVPAHIVRFALAELDVLPAGDRLCHGDLHPGNVISGPRGTAIVDWTGATHGDPAADVARTRWLVRSGAPPPGASTLTRILIRAGRDGFDRLYLRAYRRERELDLAAVDRWGPVLAAERLTHGIDAERAALIAVVERAINPNRSRA